MARAKVGGKGSKDKEKGNSKGKDTEKEKGVRFEGYCGHWQMGGLDTRIVGRDMESQ